MSLEKGAAVVQAICAAYMIWMGYNTPETHQKTLDFIVAGLLVVSLGVFTWRLLTHTPKKKGLSAPPDEVPLEDQIKICVEGTAFSVIGDKASLRLTIFSAQTVEMNFCRVQVSERTEGGFVLESAQPLKIPAFKSTHKKLERSLTTDEQARHGDKGSGRILLVQGSANFTGNVEKKFNQMIVEYL